MKKLIIASVILPLSLASVILMRQHFIVYDNETLFPLGDYSGRLALYCLDDDEDNDGRSMSVFGHDLPCFSTN